MTFHHNNTQYASNLLFKNAKYGQIFNICAVQCKRLPIVIVCQSHPIRINIFICFVIVYFAANMLKKCLGSLNEFGLNFL